MEVWIVPKDNRMERFESGDFFQSECKKLSAQISCHSKTCKLIQMNAMEEVELFRVEEQHVQIVKPIWV